MGKFGGFWKRGKKENELAATSKEDELGAQQEFDRGLSCFESGHYLAAISCFETATGLNPQYSDAWYYQGISLANLGRFDEALKCHEEALEINPQNAKAWLGKGTAETALGLGRAAAISCRKCIEVADPVQDEVTIQMARLLLR